MINKYVGVASV